MVSVEKFKSLPAKKKVILVSTVAAVLTAVILVCVVMTQGYYATTMRLLRVEGTVNIEDANGNPRSVLENVRFSSGEALSTGSDGLASVGLDDTKIVTLESDSRVEFTKSRNMLELNLTQGGLYFEVTEHLSPDETFDIRTSTVPSEETMESEEELDPEEAEAVDSIPAGYDDYTRVAWGEEYNGRTIYILDGNDGVNALLYMGAGEWIEGYLINETGFEDDSGYGECSMYYYLIDGDQVPYYEFNKIYYDPEEYDEPSFPHEGEAGYSYSQAVWGETYDGHLVYIASEGWTDPESSNGLGGVMHTIAYYNGEWVSCGNKTRSDDGTQYEYRLADGTLYYAEPV